MRPVKLTLSAFCSFKHRTEIDFEKLGREGRYLISGDTGAGKTTIFDAISFVLYGKPSGDKGRTCRDLRCLYADQDTPTEVEMVFDNGNDRYKIYRKLKFKESNGSEESDGGGADKGVSIDVELTYPSGEVKTKVKDVDDAVKEIVGLDREQFKQVVMVAQGEFERFLKAKATDRIKIFEDIFYTRRYRLLQERLNEETKAVTSRCKEMRADLERRISTMRCSDDDPLLSKVRAARAQKLPLAEASGILSELIERDKKLGESLGDELDKLDVRMSGLSADLTKAETYKTALQSLNEATADLDGAKDNLAKATAEFEAEKKHVEERENLGRQIGAMESKMGDYDKLENDVKEYNDLVKDANELNEKNERTGEEIEARRAELKRLRDEYEGIKNADAEKAKIEGELKDENGNYVSLDKLRSSLSEYENARKSYVDANKDLQTKTSHSKDLREKTDRAEEIYFAAQAGILAEGLMPGDPCPVCGSLTHPFLAVKPKDAPSKEDLDKMEKETRNAEKDASDAAAVLNGIVTDGQNKSDAVKAMASELSLDVEIKLLPKLVKNEMEKSQKKIEALGKELDAAKAKANRKQALDITIPKLEEGIDKDNDALNKEISRCSGMTSSAKTMKGHIDEARGKLQFSDKEKAQSALNSLKEKKWKLDAAYKAANERHTECDKAVSALNTRISEAKKVLVDYVPIDTAKTQETLNGLNTQKSDLTEKRGDAVARLSINKAVQEGYDEAYAEYLAEVERCGWMSGLSNTMDGGKVEANTPKMKLEAYVQNAYFEQMLSFANKRLLTMSDGAYIFESCEEVDTSSQQAGLGLNVLDLNNMRKDGLGRNARTLSGGESFQAGLALALGLSDTINMQNGGIRIESMFIDEGFGSLSVHRLDLTMKALADDMRDNRIVGIISHVEGLKGEFNKQMIVTKDESGSKVEIAVEETE